MEELRHLKPLNFLRSYFLILLLIILLDSIWLGVLQYEFIMNTLGPLMLETVKIPVAVAVYLLMPAGFVIFVSPYAKNIGRGTLFGAFFGLVLYGVFDGTNYAILANYPLTFALVDVVWGALLGACCGAVIGYLRRFDK